MQSFDDHLGTSFLQLHHSFGPEKFKMLKDFLISFPKDFPMALELRHEGWLNNPKNSDMIFELMEKLNITSVITDVAGRRDVLHQRLTTSTAFIRFTGNNLHPTDFTRAEEWVKKLKTWSEAGLKEIYFYIHEPDEICMPEMLEYTIILFNKIFHTKFKELNLNKEVQGKLF